LATTQHYAWRVSTRLLILGIVALAALGCATRGSVSRVRDDVATLRVEVTHLRQSHEAVLRDLARAVAETKSLEARVTEMAAAQRASAAEMAKLRERVEATEAVAREAKVVASLPSAPAVTPPPVAAIPPPAAPMVVRPAPRPIPRPTPPSTPLVPPSPPAPTAKEPQVRAGMAEHVYNLALATFRMGEHGQAVLDFLDFMAKYPKHPLVANAQYWIGEAYYVQHDYRQAQTEFQKVLDIAPGSAKASDALLKIGYCQLNLRDAPHALATWQRVVHEFPRSEAAGKARTLLSARGSTAPR
jgi:tol-pal system protein YbgF